MIETSYEMLPDGVREIITEDMTTEEYLIRELGLESKDTGWYIRVPEYELCDHESFMLVPLQALSMHLSIMTQRLALQERQLKGAKLRNKVLSRALANAVNDTDGTLDEGEYLLAALVQEEDDNDSAE
jgi:hypothetical protein